MSFMSDMTSPMRSKKSGVGFRFHPTDEELVDHYLIGKINSDDHDVDDNVLIPEIKVCDYEPWELPDLIKKDSNDEAWHFFSPCDYKYKHSLRFNRVTKAGFWKPTGRPRNVINKLTKGVIGTKKSLVFYKKKHPKPIRTSFIMHEYDIIAKSRGKSGFVLYKLKVNWDEKINVDGELAHQMPASPSDYTSQVTVNSSCEESEIMSTFIDCGKQNDEVEICIDYGCGDSEKDNHLGSDSENQIPNQMADDMSDRVGSEINESMPTFLESSQTFFDELPALLSPWSCVPDKE